MSATPKQPTPPDGRGAHSLHRLVSHRGRTSRPLFHIKSMLWISRANPHIRAFADWVQNGCLSVVVARGAKPVGLLSRSMLRLQRINHKSRLGLMPLVTLTLLLPVVVCCKLLLEVFIGVQCRLITLRQRQLLLRYVQDGCGELQFQFPQLGGVPSINDCLRYVYSVAYGGY